MYGTVGRFRIKDGQAGEVFKLMKEWDAADPKPKGFMANYAYQLENNPNEMVIAVVFEDKTSYFANADDPETDKWYQKVRALLESDPEWMDGEILTSSTT